MNVTQLLADAEQLVVAMSGQSDWRPLFVTGLVSAVFIAAAVTGFVLLLRKLA